MIMNEKDTKTLQVKDKAKVAVPAEQTKSGPVFTPAVDIYETEKEITLLADMPGVKAKDLNIDLNDNILTITGETEPLAGKDEQDVLIEYETGKFYRQFSVSEVINQEKIDAQLKNGVLTLILPKVEKAKPRKIAIKANA